MQIIFLSYFLFFAAEVGKSRNRSECFMIVIVVVCICFLFLVTVHLRRFVCLPLALEGFWSHGHTHVAKSEKEGEREREREISKIFLYIFYFLYIICWLSHFVLVFLSVSTQQLAAVNWPKWLCATLSALGQSNWANIPLTANVGQRFATLWTAKLPPRGSNCKIYSVTSCN